MDLLWTKSLALASKAQSINQLNWTQFYILSMFNNGQCDKVCLQKSEYKYINLNLFPMSKADVVVGKKNSLRWLEEKAFRGARLGREPSLIWVTLDNKIINHSTSKTVYYKVKQCCICVARNLSKKTIRVLSSQLFSDGVLSVPTTVNSWWSTV